MQWTAYPDIDELLRELLDRIQHILGAKLIGLYLYGSLVTGDFDHGISDIDLLAATSADVAGQDFDRLQRMHQDFAAEHTAWNDRIEVAYVSVDALRTFRSQASPIAVISPGEPFHIKEAGRDWLINWWVVRERGVALFGPFATALIDPISKQEFLRAVREQTVAWQAWIDHMRERKAQAYAILTMCRALYAYTNGEQVSKKQAAEWAQVRLPQWAPLIQQALEWRGAWRDQDVDHAATFPETVRFVRFVLDSM